MVNLFRIEKIREQDPLKQGLKLKKVVAGEVSREIREQDPLKQGLKPYHSRPCGMGAWEFASKIH